MLYALALVGYTGLIVSKHTVPMVYAAFIGLGANVAANLVLIPAFGIVGAAVATPIGMAAFLAATQIWSRTYARWHFPWGTCARALAAAAVAYVAARFAMDSVNANVTQIVAALAACAGTYVVLLVALGEHRSARST